MISHFCIKIWGYLRCFLKFLSVCTLSAELSFMNSEGGDTQSGKWDFRFILGDFRAGSGILAFLGGSRILVLHIMFMGGKHNHSLLPRYITFIIVYLCLNKKKPHFETPVFSYTIDCENDQS